METLGLKEHRELGDSLLVIKPTKTLNFDLIFQGAPGQRGPNGSPGAAGNPGERGERGFSGLKGDRGTKVWQRAVVGAWNVEVCNCWIVGRPRRERCRWPGWETRRESEHSLAQHEIE